MSKPARPYIRSSFRINYNQSVNVIDQIANSDVTVDSDNNAEVTVAERILHFLVESGFRRRKVKKRHPPRELMDTITTQPLPSSSDLLTERSAAAPKSECAVVGLRSVLRAISLPDPRLKAVLLDAELMKASAVAQTFALAAFKFFTIRSRIVYSSEPSRCPFYAIPDLSKRLASGLNLPRIHAIGIVMTDDDPSATTKLLAVLRHTLRPIELITAVAARNASFNNSANTSTTICGSQFATPVLIHTKGKARVKPKKRGKK